MTEQIDQRLNCWVGKSHKKAVKNAAKVATKKQKEKITESHIIRSLIEQSLM